MKPASVIRMAVWPLPTENSVPEAHEPPSCIPTPNRNDPTNSPNPIGASVGAAGTPCHATPPARIGANSVAATAIISMWARSPLPWRTATSWRHAEVNPNRLWNSTKPSARPMAKSTPGTCPDFSAMTQPSSAAPASPAAATPSWGALASFGGGTARTAACWPPPEGLVVADMCAFFSLRVRVRSDCCS